MIGRIWHGWTAPENADACDALLRNEIVPGIPARNVPSFHEVQVFRRALGSEVAFISIMWFDNFDAVRTFAGADDELAVVPPKARALLARSDAAAPHYEVRQTRKA
jgi:hypothetical protein